MSEANDWVRDLVGKVIRFDYPSANYRGANSPNKTRRVRVWEVRDTFSTPLATMTTVINPELRRGQYIVNGEDCDVLAERSFHEASMVNVEVFDPTTDNEWAVVEIELGTIELGAARGAGPAGSGDVVGVIESFDRDGEVGKFVVVRLLHAGTTEPEAESLADAFNLLQRHSRTSRRAIVQPSDSSVVMRLRGTVRLATS